MKNCIYLLRDRDYLKIGKAKDFRKRLKTYKGHNKYIETIHVIRNLEDNYHYAERFALSYFNDYEHSGEWFKYNPHIVRDFKRLHTIWLRTYYPEYNSDFKSIFTKIDKYTEYPIPFNTVDNIDMCLGILSTNQLIDKITFPINANDLKSTIMDLNSCSLSKSDKIIKEWKTAKLVKSEKEGRTYIYSRL